MKRFFYREAKEKLLCQPSKEQLLLSLSQVRNHIPLYMSIADDFQAQSFASFTALQQPDHGSYR